ncbi:MAG TPA: GIY-YIG nuclease family protein [bacterium]|nr:GIY-YIG nuclease family protein [bacterium]HPS30319.1 GIY-YIG nuclease family protein [bacterium]
MDKKELKREYKEAKQKNGVFQIRNTVNGKVYVAAAMNIEASFNSCRFQLKHGSTFFTKTLIDDWKKYGEDKFVFEILEELKYPEDGFFDERFELKKLEKKWLEALQPYDDSGYNRKKIER